MQTQKNSLRQILNRKHSRVAGAFLLLIILGAKVDIHLGGLVSSTLQTLVLGLAYYYLPLKWRLVLINVYITIGIMGVPVFNGGAGWSYFSSWPLGFFIGFVLSAFIPKPGSTRFLTVFLYFLLIHLVIFILGVAVVGLYADSASKAVETALELSPGLVIKSIAGAGIILLIKRVFSTRQLE